MAIVLKDRVKETTTTTGTGSFTLAGAVGGFQSFAAVGNGNITYYAAVDPVTGTWEVGKGTYSTTGPTLTRDTVYESSAAGAKISFGAGSKDVFVTYPAERAIYEEPNGNTLIDGGPLTIVGAGVTTYTSFAAVLAEMYADVNSFAQVYAQNLNDGSDASTDIVAYNDLGDGSVNFIDMGISSSNYSSATYPIFTPNSGYLYNDGGELIIGSATDDVVFFAGGVDTTDEALRINKTTRALTAAGALSVGGTLGVTGAATFSSTVLLNADPTLALQAATKQYVDGAVSNGFHVHTPVLVATTSNLTATYNNGTAGVGATLTNSGTQAALVVDGVNMATTNRVLVWQQSAPAQNGVYVVTTVGSGATNWVLTRASDADTYVAQSDTGLGGGDYFFVESGATEGFSSFICTNDGVIVFGTTAITFTLFSTVPEYNFTAPLNLTGNTVALTGTVAATNGGTGTSTVTTGDLLYGSGTNTWSKLAAGAGYRSLVMNAGGTQVEWNAVALNQSGAVSGTLPATNGGTGQSAYAVGDILYSGTTNTLAKLSGNTTTTKKFLGQTGTGSASQAPVWEQPAATDITGLAPSATTDTTNAANITSGTLPSARLNGSYTGITGVGTLTAGTWNGSAIAAIYGGTGLTSYAVGDLVYADTTTSLAKLADVATGNALISGGVGAAPSWGKIGLATHVSGTLPIANGGTNSTATPTNGGVSYGTGTAFAFNSAGTSGQLLTSAGAGAPTWTSQSSLSVGTATNVAGGAANQVLYQSGAGATTFTVAPTTAGQALTWNGSAFVWQTAGSATIQNDTSTNATYYPTFATATSGSFTDARVSSTKLTFNPNTGTLGASIMVSAGKVTSGGNNGFANDVFFAGVRNQIWSFGNASTYGLSYYQGTAGIGGADTIGFSVNGTTTPTGNNFAITPANAYVNNNIVLNASNYTSYAPSLTGSGASGTWGINVTGNAATATNLSTNRTNWSTNGTITAVVGQLAWKNYANSHTIFDASASTSPDGGAVNNTNAAVAWSGSYPTLMGWNGGSTYGVRVDSARTSDNTTGNAASLGGFAATTWIGTRGNSYYQVDTWLQLNGAHGLYVPSINDAHFHANNNSSYTAWTIRGNRNGYGGIYDLYSAVAGIMYDGGGNGGVYREANGRWYFYHSLGNNCMGVGTSITSSAYGIYVIKGVYSEGNVVAASDERKKENIEPIKDALSIVKNLVGVYYNMIADEDKKRRVGFIAQKTKPHLPEVVYYQEENDQYGVSYGDVTAVLAEAIKQLDDKLEAVMAKLV